VQRQPPFTAVLALGLGQGEDLEDLVHRFVAINGQVPRRDVVNALCVLGSGFITWGYRATGEDRPRTAYFVDADLASDIFPLFVRDAGDCFFYELATVLVGYLHAEVLDAEDIAVAYGASQKGSAPVTDQWNLHPW
jgi:hypothetical protein